MKTFDLDASRERLAAFDEERKSGLPGPRTDLSWAPERLLRREGFDSEALVEFLERRPTLLELEAERKRRGLTGRRR